MDPERKPAESVPPPDDEAIEAVAMDMREPSVQATLAAVPLACSTTISAASPPLNE